MKGIQKLFLGLFLMALISVGFNVEAKAAAKAKPVLTIDINGDGNLTLKVDGNDSGNDAFPEDGATTPSTETKAFKYDLTLSDGNGGTEMIPVLLIKSGTDSKIKIGDTSYDGTNATRVIKEKSAIISRITSLGTSTLSYTVSSADPIKVVEGYTTPTDDPSKPDSKTTFAVRKITLGAEFISVPEKTVTFSVGGSNIQSPYYLMKTSAATDFTVSSPGNGYSVQYWKSGTSILPSSDTNTYSLIAGEDAVDFTVSFIKNANGFKITGTPTFENMKVLTGKESNTRNYSISGYTGVNQIDNIYIGETPIGKSNITTTGTTSGTIKIKAPSTPVSGTMKVVMNDGVSYELGTVSVITEPTFTLPSSYSFAPSTSTNKIKPTYNVTPSSVTYNPTSTTFFTISPTTATTDGEITVSTGTNNGSATLKATATFNGIEGGTGTSVTKDATTTVSVDTLTIKDAVYVNKGLSIYLSKFIKSGSSSAETRVDQYPDLIKIDPTSGKVNGIKISGESAGTKDDSLVVSTQTGKIDVTVYPSPTLSVETSTSGPYKYTVKVPKGLYHDNVFVSEVNKAILEFKAIDHDDKTKTVTIDSLSDDSDSKLLKKGTKSIELKDLNKYIKDIAKDTDTQTIQVRAYAYNKDKDEKDDKVYSEKKEFTVYKINLDTSGNASYTVNGENVGGYFYGISDATYTIKSSATNGGKLDTTKSGDFNSGESISYKVLGARTLKAVYNASGSNANANGAAGAGMDGYDDVPKTGESRTDIWILWSVLLVSILGAGFMIWKRFGLVRAIAAADEEMAQAQEKERVEAEKKAEKDKMDMLKDLRNL